MSYFVPSLWFWSCVAEINGSSVVNINSYSLKYRFKQYLSLWLQKGLRIHFNSFLVHLSLRHSLYLTILPAFLHNVPCFTVWRHTQDLNYKAVGQLILESRHWFMADMELYTKWYMGHRWTMGFRQIGWLSDRDKWQKKWPGVGIDVNQQQVRGTDANTHQILHKQNFLFIFKHFLFFTSLQFNSFSHNVCKRLFWN